MGLVIRHCSDGGYLIKEEHHINCIRHPSVGATNDNWVKVNYGKPGFNEEAKRLPARKSSEFFCPRLELTHFFFRKSFTLSYSIGSTFQQYFLQR